jgi:hypothetical protein
MAVGASGGGGLTRDDVYMLTQRLRRLNEMDDNYNTNTYIGDYY